MKNKENNYPMPNKIQSPEEIIKNAGYDDDCTPNYVREIKNLMKKYAKQVVKYTLEEAANSAKLDLEGEYTSAVISKLSILELEQQIINDLKLK